METEDQTVVQDCVPENFDPAPIQDEYAPVIFAQETVSHIVSVDMMSGEVSNVLNFLFAFCQNSELKENSKV